MTDFNAIYRAILAAVTSAPPSSDPREIANTAIALLSKELTARQVPSTPRTQLDEFIRTFTVLDVNSVDIKRIDMGDRVDHGISIGVTSYDRLVELAIGLDLSQPSSHVDGGYSWWQSERWPERGVSITAQAHRPRRTA